MSWMKTPGTFYDIMLSFNRQLSILLMCIYSIIYCSWCIITFLLIRNDLHVWIYIFISLFTLAHSVDPPSTTLSSIYLYTFLPNKHVVVEHVFHQRNSKTIGSRIYKENLQFSDLHSRKTNIAGWKMGPLKMLFVRISSPLLPDFPATCSPEWNFLSLQKIRPTVLLEHREKNKLWFTTDFLWLTPDPT